jgi:hypothetical protein
VHQPASVRLLALSLGASSDQQSRLELARRALARVRSVCARSMRSRQGSAKRSSSSAPAVPSDDWAGIPEKEGTELTY